MLNKQSELQATCIIPLLFSYGLLAYCVMGLLNYGYVNIPFGLQFSSLKTWQWSEMYLTLTKKTLIRHSAGVETKHLTWPAAKFL